MRQYKALFINPQTREVSEIAMQAKNHLHQLYHLIDCMMVDAVRLENGDTAWIDDVGLLQPGQSFFHLPGLIADPIGGCCVIAGTDDEGGNDADCQHELNEIMQAVQWLTTQQAMEFLL